MFHFFVVWCLFLSMNLFSAFKLICVLTKIADAPSKSKHLNSLSGSVLGATLHSNCCIYSTNFLDSLRQLFSET